MLFVNWLQSLRRSLSAAEFRIHSSPKRKRRGARRYGSACGGSVAAEIEHLESRALLSAASLTMTEVGGEFRIDAGIGANWMEPSVGIDADGNFVVVWASSGQDGDGLGVFGRRFAADGTPLAGEFQVNTQSLRDQYESSVAMDSVGNFVVTWTSIEEDFTFNVYAQRFSADGTKQGDEFRVNADTAGSQERSRVAMDAAGNFIVAWNSRNSDAEDVYAQRFATDGTRLGDEFHVNSQTPGVDLRPRVDIAGTGGFAVTWSSSGTNSGVFRQQYAADGSPLGETVEVVDGSRIMASIGHDGLLTEAGPFFLTGERGFWHGGYSDVWGHWLADDEFETELTEEFLVNTDVDGGQRRPRVAMNAAGQKVIVWQSWTDQGADHQGKGIFAQRYSVVIETTPQPDAPVLTAPTGTIAESTPTFTWNAVEHAARYDLWVRNLTTGQDQVIREQHLTGTSYTTETALPNGSYRAWLRALNVNDEASGWSAAVNFLIDAAVLKPSAPTLTAPVGILDDGTPTFTWNAVEHAARYDLWVRNLTTGTDQVIREQHLTGTSYTAETTLPNGSYRAWLRAFNVNDEGGNWSAARDFTIAVEVPTPAAPALTAPSGTVNNNMPLFAWNEVEHAARYDLWVRNLTTGQDQVIREEELTGTHYAAETALPNGSYRAWLRAVNINGQAGSWSAARDFVIDVPIPAAPILTGPSGTVADNTPTFVWSEVEHAALYDLWVRNLTTGADQVIRQQHLFETSYTAETALPNGSYRFWVRAMNVNLETGNWSAARDFTVDADVPTPAAPALTSPSGTITSNTPTFGWNAVDYAARYDLWVRNLTTGQDQVIRQEHLTETFYTAPAALANGNYRFWVRAINVNDQSGNWSAARDFTINATVPKPAAPTLSSPSGAVTTNTPTFAWGQVEHAARYDLWVRNLTTGQDQVIRQQHLTDTFYTAPAALSSGNYRFWVRAFNVNDEAGNWSAALDFTIGSL